MSKEQINKLGRLPVVTTTVARSHMEQYGFSFPSDWTVKYMDWRISDDELIEACKGSDFLFVFPTQWVSRKVIENSPSLKYIQVEGVAFDKVDLKAADEHKLPVCNNKGCNALSVAEFTVGMMITLQRRIVPSDERIKAKQFLDCQVTYRKRGVKELRSAHVGIIGFGDIGKNVARMLQPFNCKKVSYYDVLLPDPHLEKNLNVEYAELEDIFRNCDIITVHTPVTEVTKNMVSTAQIEMMKEDAILINTARGEMVDQAAVAKALNAGRIYAFGTDVLSPEPPTDDHPLLNLTKEGNDRFLVTPHVAGTTDEAFENMLERTLANMQRVMNGETLQCVVNNITDPRF